MSFCRWSDDCDLYIYESDAGYVIHDCRSGFSGLDGVSVHTAIGYVRGAIESGAKVPDRVIPDLEAAADGDEEVG